MPCPRCGEDAPLVYRDYTATCSACGATRVPLAAPAVAMAGKPSQVGGAVAKIVGWVVLACGGLFSAMVFVLLNAIWPGSPAPWIAALAFLAFSIFFTSLFVMGGRSLASRGVRKEEAVRMKAIEAIARQRGGIVTAKDVAGQLRMGEPAVDAWLTDLAKRAPETLAVDVDDDGVISFRFLAYAAMPRMRVDAQPAQQAPRARVSPGVPLETEIGDGGGANEEAARRTR